MSHQLFSLDSNQVHEADCNTEHPNYFYLFVFSVLVFFMPLMFVLDMECGLMTGFCLLMMTVLLGLSFLLGFS